MSDEYAADDKCSCGGRRWVDDEGWQRPWNGCERTEGQGLLPCGFCNHGGWRVPQDACMICDVRPQAGDDIMCRECRDDCTARSDAVVDPVEIALSDHRRVEVLSDLDRQECGCGWKVEGGPALYRRHAAAHVYAALGLPGPLPWTLGPKSEMGPAMVAAGTVLSGAPEGGTDG